VCVCVGNTHNLDVMNLPTRLFAGAPREEATADFFKWETSLFVIFKRDYLPVFVSYQVPLLSAAVRRRLLQGGIVRHVIRPQRPL